ncbi:MAG: glucose-6-phosphate dehydrogenase [Hyphomicrobiaceae bacterium]
MTVQAEPARPCVLVIFGAAGDLTKRLLMPALYNLRRARLLPEAFAVIGIARANKDDDSFRREFTASLRQFTNGPIAADIDWLAHRMSYLQGDFDDPAAYDRLVHLLAKTDEAWHTRGNYLFYLATPPQAFATVTGWLHKAGLLREADGHWRHVIVEKPFGTDLHSAQELNQKLLGLLAESQIYRIDHYLGKETVQNIMVLRFANGMFEPLWNRNHIDHVQITVAETVDVERRGRFYDATGALRDMVPNHLFQLLMLIAMEPPTCFDAEAVRTEKAKVLEAAHAFGRGDASRNVVRAQYGAGTVEGRRIPPYRHAENVAPHSTTETFVALKLMIDNWRWAGVPFYMRTGKALAARCSEVVIQFKHAPFALFRDTPVDRLTPNDMTIQIQPEEGVTLRFSAKIPGPSVRMDGVAMAFNYREHFHAAPNTGYETLIYDCMRGDPTLFQRADNVEAGWRVVQPVLDAWVDDCATDIPVYPAGSAGPVEAEVLLTRDGRSWRPITSARAEKS